MNMYIKKHFLKLAAMAIITALLPFYLSTAAMSDTAKETKVTGTVSLGSTRNEVLKAMGKPESPLTCDFFYKKSKCEILIAFNDKTNLVESIIVIGKNPKYSVRGITGGSTKADVEKTFGKPERVFNYKKSGVECWYYPKTNVSFAFNGNNVSSFSVSNCKY